MVLRRLLKLTFAESRVEPMFFSRPTAGKVKEDVLEYPQARL